MTKQDWESVNAALITMAVVFGIVIVLIDLSRLA